MPYMLYEIATGRPLSQSTAEPQNVSAGRAYKEVSDFIGTWDESTLEFKPLPEQRVIDKLDFLELFSDAELESIITHSNAKVKVFIKKLDLAVTIDLKSDRMITALNGMESLGIIGVGRAAEILNG